MTTTQKGCGFFSLCGSLISTSAAFFVQLHFSVIVLTVQGSDEHECFCLLPGLWGKAVCLFKLINNELMPINTTVQQCPDSHRVVSACLMGISILNNRCVELRRYGYAQVGVTFFFFSCTLQTVTTRSDLMSLTLCALRSHSSFRSFICSCPFICVCVCYCITGDTTLCHRRKRMFLRWFLRSYRCRDGPSQAQRGILL